mmetsp:Transcript_92159/g.298396  ORF Transcript_92159/g.298396 Transcript_92159/m.298396 type:complete len:128 (+) Transcript_92159:578-961(+)
MLSGMSDSMDQLRALAATTDETVASAERLEGVLRGLQVQPQQQPQLQSDEATSGPLNYCDAVCNAPGAEKSRDEHERCYKGLERVPLVERDEPVAKRGEPEGPVDSGFVKVKSGKKKKKKSVRWACD